MKSYYECHITMECPEETDRARAKSAVEKIGWKFSVISGDIVLGDGHKAYATRHYNARIPEQTVLHHLNSAADWAEAVGVKVIRRKVEQVLYDDRSSKVRPCDGGCVECHLDDLKHG